MVVGGFLRTDIKLNTYIIHGDYEDKGVAGGGKGVETEAAPRGCDREREREKIINPRTPVHAHAYTRAMLAHPHTKKYGDEARGRGCVGHA